MLTSDDYVGKDVPFQIGSCIKPSRKHTLLIAEMQQSTMCSVLFPAWITRIWVNSKGRLERLCSANTFSLCVQKVCFSDAGPFVVDSDWSWQAILMALFDSWTPGTYLGISETSPASTQIFNHSCNSFWPRTTCAMLSFRLYGSVRILVMGISLSSVMLCF